MCRWKWSRDKRYIMQTTVITYGHTQFPSFLLDRRSRISNIEVIEILSRKYSDHLNRNIEQATSHTLNMQTT